MTKGKLRLVLRYSKLLLPDVDEAQLNVLMEDIMILHRHGLVKTAEKVKVKGKHVTLDTQEQVFRITNAIEELMYVRLQKVKELNGNFDKFFNLVDNGVTVKDTTTLYNIRHQIDKSMSAWIESLNPRNTAIMDEINAGLLTQDVDIKLK